VRVFADELCWFSSTPEAASLARRQVAAACHGLDEHTSFVALLLTSELVTNAFLHPRSAPDGGEAGIFVRVHRSGDVLRVEVFDHDAARLPVPAAAALSAESGRGLDLVSKLSGSWGSGRVHDQGKVVWFVLGVTTPG